MAVLVEALTVIVKRSVIDRKLPGGYGAFRTMIGTRAVCTDGELVAGVLFDPDEVEQFVSELARFDIHYTPADESEAVDVAVVDQNEGLLCNAPWLIWGRVDLDGIGPVTTVAAAGTSLASVTCPDGWSYDLSVSREHQFIPNDKAKHLLLLDRESGLDRYVYLESGAIFYQPTPRKPSSFFPISPAQSSTERTKGIDPSRTREEGSA